MYACMYVLCISLITIHLIYFTHGGCIAEDLKKRIVTFGAIWTRNRFNMNKL